MGSGTNERLRTLIADEAARLILDEGMSDYAAARSKAARRLGARGKSALPTPAEIEESVNSRRMIFGLAVTQEDEVFLQRLALRLMREFAGYQPRLVGALVEGVITSSSDICLHLIAENAKLVAIDLLNRGVDYRGVDQSFHGVVKTVPGFSYEAENVSVSLFVFSRSSDRNVIRDVRSGGGVKGASLAEWEAVAKEGFRG